LIAPLAHAARRLATRPGVASTSVRVLEGMGAQTLADHVDRIRAGGDLVPISVPPGFRSLRSHRFRMYSLEDRDQVVRAIRRGGWLSFEAPLPSVLALLVRRWPDTFLDVGANTGFYSLLAVTAHRKARAVAFEPVPEIVDLLRANLAVNPQGTRVGVRAVAIGDRRGTADLHLPPPQADGTVETSASLDPSFKDTIERVVRVDADTLDGAWAAAGRPAVSVVRIDVEGAEPTVLAGADELIEACRPVLTIEVLQGADLPALDRLREQLGYLDVALGEREAVVGGGPITPHDQAPNHLLVPRERVTAVVEQLGYVPRLVVTRLD
jgi:FkbM family methyltransferase